jgi:SAM-dependent methyltransferase
MVGTKRGDAWSSGDAYEAYIGRWSRVTARDFVAWLGVGPGLRWLDVGCGTGALSAAVIDHADPAGLLGIDASPAYAEEAQRRVADPRARFECRNADSVTGTGQFDVAVSGLVLNFLADPGAVIDAMARAVDPGGVVAAYVWDYAGRMELLRMFWDDAVLLDPSARDLDEGVRFPGCDPDSLAQLWHGAALGSVETTAIDVETTFADFDDYWSPFLGGQGPAPGYVSSLSEPQRLALRDALRDALPIAADGSISLIARAWAVRGHR